MIKARASGSKVYLYLMKKGRQARHSDFKGILVLLSELSSFLMILYSCVQQVMTICRIQEWQLSLSYFLSYFPLIISAAISCPLNNLNALANLSMILHSYIEQVMMMCPVQ